MEDTTFIWHLESNFVLVTFDIFRKKRVREEEEEEEEEKKESRVIFKVEGSQYPPSFVRRSKIDT
jgi:hypothetical protein